MLEHNADYSLYFLLRTSGSSEMTMKFSDISTKILISDHKQTKRLGFFEIATIILSPSTEVPRVLGQI